MPAILVHIQEVIDEATASINLPSHSTPSATEYLDHAIELLFSPSLDEHEVKLRLLRQVNSLLTSSSINEIPRAIELVQRALNWPGAGANVILHIDAITLLDRTGRSIESDQFLKVRPVTFSIQLTEVGSSRFLLLDLFTLYKRRLPFHIGAPREASSSPRCHRPPATLHSYVESWDTDQVFSAFTFFSTIIELAPTNHPDIPTSFYTIGSLLHALGEYSMEKQVYDAAVRSGVWHSVAQRPGYVFPHKDLSLGGAWPDSQFLLTSKLSAAVTTLEDAFFDIKQEYLGFVDTQQHQQREDEEALVDRGKWRQFTLVKEGKEVDVAAWHFFPKTHAVIRLLMKQFAPRLPKGSVEFSSLAPNTHIKAHCGPTDHRIRLHLGLVVPEPGLAAIRVGEETRSWEEGKVLVFNDSFEHEIWNNATLNRVVLILDVWHPSLTEADRAIVRKEFLHANQ